MYLKKKRQCNEFVHNTYNIQIKNKLLIPYFETTKKNMWIFILLSCYIERWYRYLLLKFWELVHSYVCNEKLVWKEHKYLFPDPTLLL